MASNFSFPSMRYFWCHSREPVGFTNKNSLLKSETLYDLSRGLRFRIVASVKGMMGVAPFQQSTGTPKSTPNSGVSQRALLDMVGQKDVTKPRYNMVLGSHWLILDEKWWRGGDSNPRPCDYESHALTN